MNVLLWFFTDRYDFLFNHTATTKIYTLSLHDALPISRCRSWTGAGARTPRHWFGGWRHEGIAYRANAAARSEEHTSELQSRFDLVCRLLLEKKKLFELTRCSCFRHTIPTTL